VTDERDIPPADLRALARERSQARRERRFGDADRLRAEIEATGWRIVDRGTETRLVRAHPLDALDPDGVIRYGWSGAVPEASGGDPDAVTVVLRALPGVEAADALVARLIGDGAAHRHALVVVGEGGTIPTVEGLEVVRLRGDVGAGTLLAVALRRVAAGTIVVGERWPADASSADLDGLAARLAEPGVAIAGLHPRRSTDLRHFTSGGQADTPVEAVGWAGLAFRARDGRARGPVDEAFHDAELLAAWWSLVLRDEGPEAAPRQAVAIRASTSATEEDERPPRENHATRRDRYRIIDRFHSRQELRTDRG
jgi:hypothetical protein